MSLNITSALPDTANVVEAVLEGFVRAAQLIVRAGLVPPFPHDADVIYQEERPGADDWKLPHLVMRDGWGDCEDLAIWMAAGLRETDEDADARVIIVRTGPGRLHAIVERSDGSIDDPSRDLYQGKAKRR